MLTTTLNQVENIIHIIGSYIFILSSIGVSIASVNVMILVYISSYWYRVKNRRRKERVLNDSNYKDAMVNCVKYGISSSILFFEVVTFIFVIIPHFLKGDSCNNLENPTKHCGVITFVHHNMEYLTLAWFILPLCFINMLCLFFIELIAHSRVDIDILRYQGWKTFWLFTCTLAIGAIQNDITFNIGVIITCLINISLCWIACKSAIKLFKSLKSKRLDYLYNPKALKYFTSQATNFKWSSLLVAIPCCSSLVVNRILPRGI